jgi:ankyrin repeat protein
MAVQGDQPNSLIYFIDKYNMDINSKDNLGSTPLHWACYLGYENSVNFIIHKYSREVDINNKDNTGLTSLHLAVLSGMNIIIY